MKAKNTLLEGKDFISFIARGATRLTPADVQELIADMPDILERFGRLSEAGYPEAERQLRFLAKIVELVWTGQYKDMPYGAALEATFAVSYFAREIDLIPDILGPMGFIDDIAVAQTVLVRNATAFHNFSAAMSVPLKAASA